MRLITGTSAKELWNIGGELCELKGTAVPDGLGYTYANAEYQLRAEVEKNPGGVYSRRDELVNVSRKDIVVHSITAKFRFEGCEFDAYVQASGWVHESTGAWQNLVSGVRARCESVRTSSGAAPFAALWNRQTNRGIAFHLLADGAWQINITRVLTSDGRAYAEVEMGLDGRDMAIRLQPGEKFELPEILFYDIRNRVDLDCYKLHDYCNARWPRRELPVVFNSWLYRFSDLSVDSMLACVPVAQKIGCEYFVIDAGWFGKSANWGESIGDWTENENSAFCGRMIEVAEAVRAHSMKFGLWFEIESALGSSDAVKTHPEHFIEYEGGYFLDFASSAACEYMLDVLSSQIKKYGIEFIKFDFNADLCYDKYHSAFTRYYAGYRAFMRELRRRHPEVYCQNCASGGQRMNLTNLADFDSYWFSDDQSPHTGLDIIKNTLKRLPPQAFERWACIQSLKDVRTYSRPNAEKLISTDSSTWESIIGIQESWLRAFLTGGGYGFSCDLTKLSDSAVDMLSRFATEFKEKRAFWNTASCRILIDSENVIALQYSDKALSDIVIVVYIKTILQRSVQIFPALDIAAEYIMPDGEILSAEAIDEDGIFVPVASNQAEGNRHARILTIKKKN